MFGVYCPGVMKRLLQLKADMAADPELPADFDMCITVMSGPWAVQDTPPQPLTPASHKPVVEKFGVGSREELANYIQVRWDPAGAMSSAG